MQQWFNLLFTVAKPAFKSLIYAGTNNLLNYWQEELKDQQKQQNKLILESFNGNHNLLTLFKRQEESYQATELVENPNCYDGDFLQELTSVFKQTGLDFQQQRFQKEKALQQQLLQEKRAILLQLAAYQRETTLQLPEINKIFAHWPLKLFPSQLLASHTTNENPPLKVFIAPPKFTFPECNQSGIECKLTQGLREFISQHYSLHNQVRATEFLGGAWESKRFHGEASIKALFTMLKSEPTLILESEVEDDKLHFRLGYWGLGQHQYYYETIFTFPYYDFLLTSAKERAKQWQNIANNLVNLGKTPEEIAKLGAECQTNWTLLQEEEYLLSQGINTCDFTFAYQIGKRDIEQLVQFLVTCHSIVTAWLVDIHYLIQDDQEPILPELLPSLMANYGVHQDLAEVFNTVISAYQEVILFLTKERPYWLPELSLKLAHSLLNSAPYLAHLQLEYSWENWLHQHQLNKNHIEYKFYSDQEIKYLENLQMCWSKLGEEKKANQVKQWLQPHTYQLKKVTRYCLKKEVINFEEPILSLQLIEQGKTLVIGGERSIVIWEKNEGKFQFSRRLSSTPGITCYHTDDSQLLVTSDRSSGRSQIKIWNLATGKLTKTLFGHKKTIQALILNTDQQLIISASHKIKLWNATTGEAIKTLFGHKEWVYALEISADSQTLVSGSQDQTIRIWNLSNGQLLHTLRGHQGVVRTLVISPNQEYLFSGSDDHNIKVWNLSTGKLVKTISGHDGAIHNLIISQDGQYLISSSADKTIKIWQFPQLELLQTLSADTAAVKAIALSQDGQTLISGSRDRTITIWQRE